MNGVDVFLKMSIIRCSYKFEVQITTAFIFILSDYKLACHINMTKSYTLIKLNDFKVMNRYYVYYTNVLDKFYNN